MSMLPSLYESRKPAKRGTVWVRCLLLCLLVGAAPLNAAAQEGAGAPLPPMHLRVTTPDYELVAGVLRVAGLDFLTTPGAPTLPVWSQMIPVPANTEWHVEIRSAASSTLSSQGRLLPAAGPADGLLHPFGWSPMDEVSVVQQEDPAIYDHDGFFPAEFVQLGQQMSQRGQDWLPVHVFPFQYNPVTGELLYRPDVEVIVTFTPASVSPDPGVMTAPLPAAAGVSAEAGAVWLDTGERGMYRIDSTDLSAVGVDPTTIDPRTLEVDYLGEPVDIDVSGQEDGQFDDGDGIVFFAEPYQGRYQTHNTYRLSYGGEASSSRMGTRAAPPDAGITELSTITVTTHLENDLVYYSSYHLPNDADHWFDNPLYPNSYAPTATVTYTLELENAVDVGEAVVRVAMHGGVDLEPNPDQSVAVALQDHSVGLYQWEGSTSYTATATIPAEWVVNQPVELALQSSLAQLPDITAYWVSPDWIELSYPSQARAENDRLYVEGLQPGADTAASAGFLGADVSVYDVSDARHPVILAETEQSDVCGEPCVRFGVPGGLGSYALSSTSGFLKPVAIRIDEPSNWKSPDHNADYIAIVHPSLWASIQPLLVRRADEGFRVAKVDVMDVYDEFSAGRVDPEAIRSFLSYAYHNWNQGQDPPEYVLLVGDGHYDFKDVSGTGLPNLIPPYLADVDPWIGETAADNRYVSVDGPNDYLPDMHVGRIPAKTPEDVATLIDKIVAYEDTAEPGDWQRRVVFVADDASDPAGDFHALSDEVRLKWLPDDFEDIQLYYKSGASLDTGEEMRNAIKNAFDQGAVMLQWFGHASKARWGSVSMFDLLDPPQLTSSPYLPFTASYACWSGYFINITGSRIYNYNEQSLAEVLLLTPGRGSVVDLSPSGLHIGGALLQLNEGIVDALFVDRVGRIGQAIDAGKRYFYGHSASGFDLIDTSVLFGDPALRVRIPPGTLKFPLVGSATP